MLHAIITEQDVQMSVAVALLIGFDPFCMGSVKGGVVV